MSSESRIWGEVVDNEVVTQVQKREGKLGASTFNTDDLQFIHGNTAWALLRSGVDIEKNGKGRSSEDAKKYKLGLVSGNSELAGYSFDTSFGVRPFPGITSIEVSNKDTLGCIQEANIHIRVWTKTDLDYIDSLFFKPGMPALLEYGHVTYVDNDGALKKGGKGISTISDKDFFDPNVTWSNIEEKLETNRKNACGNYEGMIGLIVNFSYSFVEEGGYYEGSVKLLSKGGVLEGLQIPRSYDESTQMACSEINRILEAIEEQTPEAFKVVRTVKPFDSVTLAYEMHLRTFRLVNYPNLPEITVLGGGTSKNDKKKGTQIAEKSQEYVRSWMKLRDFLNILNCAIPEELQDKIRFNADNGNKYLTAKKLFSLDPGVALKPSKPGSPFRECYISGSDYEVEESSSDYISNIWVNTGYIREVVSNIIENNTSYNLLDVLEQVLAGIQKAFGNVNYFTWYLRHDVELEDAVHYDVYEIVDRNCIVRGTETDFPKIKVSGPGTTVRKLSIESLVSPDIADAVSIAATNPALGSDADVSADLVKWNENSVSRFCRVKQDSTSKGTGTTNSTSYVLQPSGNSSNSGNYRYNKPAAQPPSAGASNKDWRLPFTFVKGNSSKPSVVKEELGFDFDLADYNNFKTKVTTIYKNWGSNTDISDSEDVGSNQIQLTGESIFNRIVRHQASKGTINGVGIIPVKVGISMMGISRFIIGTTFKVADPSPIPSKYKDWGYIITKVSNTIDGSGWVTTLGTQYFPITKRNPDTETREDEEPSETVTFTVTRDGRGNGSSQQTGKLSVDGVEFCDTLENPNPDYLFPTGEYQVQYVNSPTFRKNMPRIYIGTKGTNILIHSGNTKDDSKGCILVGKWNPRTNQLENSSNVFSKLISDYFTENRKIQIIIT